MMKSLVIILMLFFLPIKNYSQAKYNYKQGYKFINKAEKNLKQGKLKKADRFLKKARQSNYGFCGNAWMDAFESINFIQAQVYINRKDFDKALLYLDSMHGSSFDNDYNLRDSLKVSVLILKFGKDTVKKYFEQIKEVKISSCNTFFFNIKSSIVIDAT